MNTIHFPVIKHHEATTVVLKDYVDIFYGYRFNLDDLSEVDAKAFMRALDSGVLQLIKESTIKCEPFFTECNKYPKDSYCPIFPFDFASNVRINSLEFKVFRNISMFGEENDILFDGCNVFFNKQANEHGIVEGDGNFELVLWYRAVNFTELGHISFGEINQIYTPTKYNPTLSNSQTQVVKFRGFS